MLEPVERDDLRDSLSAVERVDLRERVEPVKSLSFGTIGTGVPPPTIPTMPAAPPFVSRLFA